MVRVAAEVVGSVITGLGPASVPLRCAWNRVMPCCQGQSTPRCDGYVNIDPEKILDGGSLDGNCLKCRLKHYARRRGGEILLGVYL